MASSEWGTHLRSTAPGGSLACACTGPASYTLKAVRSTGCWWSRTRGVEKNAKVCPCEWEMRNPQSVAHAPPCHQGLITPWVKEARSRSWRVHRTLLTAPCPPLSLLRAFLCLTGQEAVASRPSEQPGGGEIRWLPGVSRHSDVHHRSRCHRPQVWKRQEAAKAEERKADELRKQLEEERKANEYLQIAEQAGHLKCACWQGWRGRGA